MQNVFAAGNVYLNGTSVSQQNINASGSAVVSGVHLMTDTKKDESASAAPQPTVQKVRLGGKAEAGPIRANHASQDVEMDGEAKAQSIVAGDAAAPLKKAESVVIFTKKRIIAAMVTFVFAIAALLARHYIAGWFKSEASDVPGAAGPSKRSE